MKKLVKCPLSEQAKFHPTDPAIITSERIFTYQEFNNAVLNLQDHLETLHIKNGDRLAVISDNSAQLIFLLYALWRLKAVTCLISTRLPVDSRQTQIKSLGCKHIFSEDTALPISFDDRNDFSSTIDLNQDVTIMYTSGSDGNPKAALHSFGNHYASGEASNDNIPFTINHRWLINLPLYHVSGLSIIFRSLVSGGCMVLAENNASIVETVKKHNITHLSLVPTQLQRILNQNNIKPLQSCESILVGGGPVWHSLKKDIAKHNLPVHITYGLTEMSSQVATTDVITENTIEEGARILGHCEVKLSEVGEILLKGTSRFRGYMKEGILQPFDSESWFKTGDLGRLDNGRLWMTGRKDHMFISGGENIQPEEIEECLKNIESLEEAIVVPIPHKEFGFRPVAFVKLKEEGEIRPEELRQSLIKKLPSYKIPDQFLPWPTFKDTLKVNRKAFLQHASDINS